MFGTSPEGFVEVGSLGDLEYVVEGFGNNVCFLLCVVGSDAVAFEVVVHARLFAC